LTHTILFDVPETIVEYSNRVGRTARINTKGMSILVLNNTEVDYI